MRQNACLCTRPLLCCSLRQEQSDPCTDARTVVGPGELPSVRENLCEGDFPKETKRLLQ